MNRARVKIIVFPADINLSRIENYDESAYGKVFSTLNEIHVNNVNDGYTILYTADLFEQLDTAIFSDNVIEMLTGALPKTMIDIDINYIYMGDFSEDCGIAIMKIDDYMSEIENPYVEYDESPSVAHLIDSWDDDTQEFDLTICEECHQSPCTCDVCCEDYPDCNCADDDDDDEPCPVCGKPFCICDDSDEDEEDDDDYYDPIRAFQDVTEGKMKKKYYGRSSVAKKSTKLKKQIKRHGVIISSDKNARKRDEKVIRAFLKDFLPGKERWIKKYREEVLMRWMATYTISKKQAKRLARAHKEKLKSKSGKKKITKEQAMDFTRTLFQPDLWGDINK